MLRKASIIVLFLVFSYGAMPAAGKRSAQLSERGEALHIAEPGSMGLPFPQSDSQVRVGAQSPTDRAAYNVRSFGAVGDGKNLDSPSINQAIEACAKAGGGTVYFPAGTYLSGSIRLKNNINLFIDAGASIVGAPQEMKAYDPPETFEGKAYQDGGHTYFHNSLIWGENLANVFITGQGMINGGGLTSRDNAVGAGPIILGDKAIALKRCRN
ncbi:MAG: glycosyl hydrolase family 28-related protein, partial [Acidobacteriota bacterium]